MARNAVVFKVLIASPADVQAERQTVVSVIERWNNAHSTAMGVMLEPIQWETHAHPAAGDYPQGIINQQIVDDSDVVVGIFWSRLGTPTPSAASGTAEEIERLRARGKRVLLYFSLADLPQDHDRAQFDRLQGYKETLRKDTFYWEFETPDQLDQQFSGHLATVVHELASETNAKPQDATKRVSNLVALRPLPTPRFVSRDESDTWRDSEEGTEDNPSLRAAIAIFRNDPIKGMSLREITGLRAQITFYEANGGEVQRIHHGCWLGEPFNSTHLSTSDTQELIIAVDYPQLPLPLTLENTRHKAVDYETSGTQLKPLERKLYDVNVRLVGRAAAEGDVVDDFRFSLDLRNETPVLKIGWTK
jgi:Domain of unknown function (DUF4062)